MLFRSNYVNMLHDEKFWNGMKLSAFYVLLNIPVQTVFALGLAMLLSQKWIKGVKLWRLAVG